MALMLPARGAVIVVFIFIASRISTGCPWVTASPTATSTLTTVPESGLATSPGWVAKAGAAALAVGGG
jgi:hypothetical protein